MTGTSKKNLLVMKKSRIPRCFKNIKYLPVTYEANKRAWTPSELLLIKIIIKLNINYIYKNVYRLKYFTFVV